MDEAPERQAGETAYLKLPWPAVAGALLAVLAIALAAGLLANRYLRPQVTPVPIPTEFPVAAPTPTVQQSVPPSPPTATPVVVPTPTLAVIAAPTVPIAAPTIAPSPVPTVDPVLAAEVGQAYETYWRIRAQALLQLDTTHLSEVMDGDHLAGVAQRIEELRVEGRAIKTKVSLNYEVVKADASSAAVSDRIEDDSYYVKAGTEEPLVEPTKDFLVVLYQLRMSSGVWKVIDSVGAN